MVNFVGWLGAALLALCAAPQAYQSVMQGHSQGVAPLFIFMWFMGEWCAMIYVYHTREYVDWPLIANYILNMFFITIIWWYM